MSVTSVKSPEEFLYYDPLEDDYVLYDPWAEEPWQPDSPFRTLTNDRITADGVAYLRERALEKRPLTARLVGSYHGQKSHWTDTETQRGDLLEQSRVLWVEADWESEENSDAIRTLPNVVVPQSEGQRAFVEAEIGWAQNRGIRIVPFDIDGPSEPLRTSLKTLFSLPSETRFDLGEGLDQQHIHAYLAQTIYYAIREEMLPGMIGSLLRIIDQQAPMLDEANMVIGTSHLTWLPPVLGRCGVQAEIYPVEHRVDPPSTPEALRARSLRNELIASHRISLQKLGELSMSIL